MKDLIKYFSAHYVPRWMVLLFDLSVAFASWFLSYVIRFNFDLSSVEQASTPLSYLIVFPALIFCFHRHKSYAGILRHSTIKDIVRIVSAIVCTGIILSVISLTARYFNAPQFFILPLSVVIIFVLMVSTMLSLSRILTKILFQHWSRNHHVSKKVMIWGAGQLGQTTYNALLSDSSVNFTLVGYIDNNATLKHKYLTGIPIYSEEYAFKTIIPSQNVSEIIFAIDSTEISKRRKSQIADKCIELGLVVKEIPPVKKWINGELQASSIQKIEIEDLLGRNSIKLDRQKVATGLKGATVLVTGAAGSIGSEIVRLLCNFEVKRIIILDKAESDLYDLQQEIIRMNKKTDFKAIVGDVSNKKTLRKVFQEYLPTIVFNAAAYKHVPLMEEFPNEAIRVNVKGLKNAADLAIEFDVQKFVLISTDKAVNPTNVMGATKRISEIYIQALAHSGNYSTQFITTRFGNVLGSNGSVVPLFKKQIESGGPITVTHNEITRFFMTIPEACQLVLEAGFMGKGGEIFVFDMGSPVKIYDLAKKMISLSGLVLDQDIKIEITGLRPGEKLYEELLTDKEKLLKHTYNDKIMVGKDTRHDLNLISRQINLLINNIDNAPQNQLVKLMRHMVPEFVPMNSVYIGTNKKDSPALVHKNGYNNTTRKHILNHKRIKRSQNDEIIY